MARVKHSEVRTPAVRSVSAERHLQCNYTSLCVFCDATVEHVCTRTAFSPFGTWLVNGNQLSLSASAYSLSILHVSRYPHVIFFGKSARKSTKHLSSLLQDFLKPININIRNSLNRKDLIFAKFLTIFAERKMTLLAAKFFGAYL